MIGLRLNLLISFHPNSYPSLAFHYLLTHYRYKKKKMNLSQLTTNCNARTFAVRQLTRGPPTVAPKRNGREAQTKKKEVSETS